MIDWEKFVKIWQAASTVGEVADQLAIEPMYASSRASYLRKKGVPLKTFRTVNHGLDVKNLKKLCK